jgi:RNA polymerase sigma-70 factor, ECF subfamily
MREPPSLATQQEQLIAQHRARLSRYVQSLVHNRSDAEDLMQEIMLRAHRGFDDLRQTEAGVTWLFRIATHACLDHLRQRGRRPAIDVGADPDTLEEPGDDQVTLQTTIERQEMSECVQRFLVALPDDYRAVIMLAEIEGLTGREISELLGVPLTTVKMRLHRARRMLQEELEAGCSFCCDDRGVLVCEPKR